MSPSLDCKLLEGKSELESSQQFFAQGLAHSLVNDPKGPEVQSIKKWSNAQPWLGSATCLDWTSGKAASQVGGTKVFLAYDTKKQADPSIHMTYDF